MDSLPKKRTSRSAAGGAKLSLPFPTHRPSRSLVIEADDSRDNHDAAEAVDDRTATHGTVPNLTPADTTAIPRPPNAWILYRSHKLQQLRETNQAQAPSTSGPLRKSRSSRGADRFQSGGLTATALAALEAMGGVASDAGEAATESSSFETRHRQSSPTPSLTTTSFSLSTSGPSASLFSSGSRHQAAHSTTSASANDIGSSRPSGGDISTLLAKLWKSEPDSVKQSFHDLAKEKVEEHKRTWPDYKYQPRATEKVKLAKERRRARSKTNREEAEEQDDQVFVTPKKPVASSSRHASPSKAVSSKRIPRSTAAAGSSNRLERSSVSPARQAARPYPVTSPRRQAQQDQQRPNSSLRRSPRLRGPTSNPASPSYTPDPGAMSLTITRNVSGDSTFAEHHQSSRIDMDTDETTMPISPGRWASEHSQALTQLHQRSFSMASSNGMMLDNPQDLFADASMAAQRQTGSRLSSAHHDNNDNEDYLSHIDNCNLDLSFEYVNWAATASTTVKKEDQSRATSTTVNPLVDIDPQLLIQNGAHHPALQPNGTMFLDPSSFLGLPPYDPDRIPSDTYDFKPLEEAPFALLGQMNNDAIPGQLEDPSPALDPGPTWTEADARFVRSLLDQAHPTQSRTEDQTVPEEDDSTGTVIVHDPPLVAELEEPLMPLPDSPLPQPMELNNGHHNDLNRSFSWDFPGRPLHQAPTTPNSAVRSSRNLLASPTRATRYPRPRRVQLHPDGEASINTTSSITFPLFADTHAPLTTPSRASRTMHRLQRDMAKDDSHSSRFVNSMSQLDTGIGSSNNIQSTPFPSHRHPSQVQDEYGSDSQPTPSFAHFLGGTSSTSSDDRVLRLHGEYTEDELYDLLAARRTSRAYTRERGA